MSVCLPVPIFLPISICLSCYINIYLYMFLHISLSISPAIYLSFCVSIWPTFFCWTVQLRVPLTVTLLSTADMSTLRPTRTHALFFSSFTSLSSSHHVITVSKHVITLNGNHVISDSEVMFQFFFPLSFSPFAIPILVAIKWDPVNGHITREQPLGYQNPCHICCTTGERSVKPLPAASPLSEYCCSLICWCYVARCQDLSRPAITVGVTAVCSAAVTGNVS